MIVNPSTGAANLDGVKMFSTVIPKGRMKGDVDGDGRITEADVSLIREKIIGNIQFDTVQTWCADVYGDDGKADSLDVQKLSSYLAGNPVTINFADYYENWTCVKEDEQTPYWTVEIPIPGLTTEMSVSVIVGGECGAGMFSRGKITGEAIQISSIAPPVTDVPCSIIYGAGDGTVVVCGRLLPTPDDIRAARAPKIVTVELLASAWNTSNNIQSVSAVGVAKDDSTQIIQCIPHPKYNVLYTKCGIARTLCTTTDDTLRFHAETIPTMDITLDILITDLT